MIKEYLAPKSFIRKSKIKINATKRKILTPFVHLSENPLFILGNQKSGTTVIAALLALYSNSSVTLDLKPNAGRCAVDIKSGMHPFSSLLKKYKFELSKDIIKDLWLTFLFDDLISYFPESIFMQIVRDPRDTIRSILNRLNVPGNLSTFDISSLSPKDIGWYYVLDNSWIGITEGNYIEILAKRWNYCIDTYLSHKENIILIKYEDFLKDKKGYIQNLAKRINLPEKKDISQKLDYQFQPRGNRKITWEEFFGERNLQKINHICNDRTNKIGYKVRK